MRVEDLRNHGLAFSDAESRWPPALKKRMRRTGRALVLSHLGPWQRVRFLVAFVREHRRMKRHDLSAIRARGMTNEPFLAQQIEYIAMFSALARVAGTARAVEICCELMDATAREALLLCLPERDDLARFPDPLAAYRAFVDPVPAASRAAGCNEVRLVDEPDGGFLFEITWCVWLELARELGVPEACLPNCHADQLVFPDYFASLGIDYRRTGTLAQGCATCDFRFARPRR